MPHPQTASWSACARMTEGLDRVASRVVSPHEGVRTRLEAREELLSPYATRSRHSKGRARREDPSATRTEFQRDRDRIIHCKSFRRLKHKTQVFIAPLGDHYVTRLTHTL